MARIAYHARWVLPIASPAIADGAIVVEGSVLRSIGSSVNATADRHVRLGNAVLMPGLVNAHSHLELTALRGFLEGLDFREWLRVLTEARRLVLTPDALMDSATIGIHEGLLAGITTFADCTESGVPIAAMRAAGVRGIGYIEVFGPDPAVRDASMLGLQQSVNALRVHDTALVQTGVSPHAPYTVSAPLFRAVGDWAREEKLPLAVHVAEGTAEVSLIRDGTGPFAERLRARGIEVQGSGLSPVALLADTGILDTQALLIHGVQMNDRDAEIVAQHGASIVHCPISNAKLGHGIAPLDLFLNAGIATGLGTDSVASNDRMDILSEARQASLFQSIRLMKPDAFSAADALALATIGGARALKLDHRIGTLEVGKEADVVAFPLDRIEALPSYDPVISLVHALAGAVTAQLVLVAGVERVRDGRVVDADETLTVRFTNIGSRLQQWRAQLR
ncbi:MAG: amidohydrolase family protein [Gemmatimonas sp.]